jgi:hypothetical protein
MNTRISQAVAAALTLGATVGAHAIDMSGVSTSNILYISGSTAIDNGIQQRFINTTDGLCAAGTIDIYAGTQAGVKFTGVACNASARATSFSPITLNAPIAYFKEDNAGSRNGIDPVNNATAIAFPTPGLMTTANCPGTTLNGGTSSPHTCNASVTATNVAPQFGYSDVNAQLFGAATTNLNTSASLDTLFGIGASLGFYHALQQLQGLTADDNVADMPSLTRGQVYSILQNILFPAILKNSSGTTNAGATTQLFGTNTVAASFCGNATTSCVTSDVNNIYICQRGQSSGTEQTSQVYFGDIGCTSGNNAFLAPTTATCSASGCGWSTSFNSDISFAGSGTGDVLSCLQGHDSIGHFAIGIVGIENGWGTYQTNAARKDFRFIKINNVVPSFENVAADRYQYWAQSASYAPKAGRPNVAAGVAGGLASAAAQIGSAATVAALNNSFNYTAPAFDGGFLAIPGVGTNVPNASSVTALNFRSNPVNTYNRGAPTATNECQPPAMDSTAPDSSDFPTWAGP